jgi:hypothetical protein
MGISSLLKASIAALLRRRIRNEFAQFLQRTRDCRAEQHRVLSELLQLNGDSKFSRERGLLSATSVDDLRSSLPVTTYEDYRSIIEAVKSGDSAALLGSRNKLLMFSLSSGTTSDSKFIPVTERFYRDYRRGWQFWGIAAFDKHTHLNQVKILQISSDYDRYRTQGNIPCGNISGMAAVNQQRIVRRMYTLPFELTKIETPEAKYYTALRLAVADSHVGLVMTANPSTLVHLAQMANEQKADLIRDIYDGTLTVADELSAPVRGALSKRIARRDPARARELDRCVERTGQLLPRDYWPELTMVAVWTGGSCAAYLPNLREMFGDVPVRDHGLSASEGRMTIPLADGTPDGVLDISTHFFEFIPAGEYASASPTVLEAHELEEGHDYYILLTTASGFYRYDICDVVRCTGFEGTTPICRFLHKGAHISSITGEKLSESQVVEAVRTTLDEFNHRVKYFTFVPSWGQPPSYRLLVEDSELIAAGAVSEFEQRLDERLCELNCEYGEKRSTGRLQQARITKLRSGSWTEFARQRQSRLGGSIEQYKHPCLLPDMQAAEKMVAQFACPGANND